MVWFFFFQCDNSTSGRRGTSRPLVPLVARDVPLKKPVVAGSCGLARRWELLGRGSGA